MPIFLDTSGNSSLAIAICGRCSKKYPIGKLRSDGNSSGLMVCDEGCWDPLDPWRLAARAPDNIALRFARPDTDLDPAPTYTPAASS